MFGVQLYKNNARALLSRILSILNLDWLQYACSVPKCMNVIWMNGVHVSHYMRLVQHILQIKIIYSGVVNLVLQEHYMLDKSQQCYFIMQTCTLNGVYLWILYLTEFMSHAYSEQSIESTLIQGSVTLCIWRGGFSHIKTYRDVPLQWFAFPQEIPKHGSHFLQTIPKHCSVFPKFRPVRFQVKIWIQIFFLNFRLFLYLCVHKSIGDFKISDFSCHFQAFLFVVTHTPENFGCSVKIVKNRSIFRDKSLKLFAVYGANVWWNVRHLKLALGSTNIANPWSYLCFLYPLSLFQDSSHQYW